jgi:hypothetical protein
MPRRLHLVALLAAAALLCATPATAAVIVHRVSASFEDGIPGLDPTATSSCQSNVCVGGTRDGQGCGQPRDCPSTLDNELVWQAGHIHVV